MKPTKNALLEALRKFGRALPKRPAGDGWYTLQELSQQEGVSVPALRYKMQMAKKRGFVFEQAAGTALDDEGNARRTTYFRLRGKP